VCRSAAWTISEALVAEPAFDGENIVRAESSSATESVWRRAGRQNRPGVDFRLRRRSAGRKLMVHDRVGIVEHGRAVPIHICGTRFWLMYLTTACGRGAERIDRRGKQHFLHRFRSGGGSARPSRRAIGVIDAEEKLKVRGMWGGGGAGQTRPMGDHRKNAVVEMAPTQGLGGPDR